MNKRQIQLLVVASTTAGAVAAVGTIAIVRAVRRRRQRRMVPKRVRKVMGEVLDTRIEDVAPEGSARESLLHHFINSLDDKRLFILFAFVQMGHFVKESGIDPLHPSKEQAKTALSEYLRIEHEAAAANDKAAVRSALLEHVSPESSAALFDALSTALSVIAHAA